MAALTADRNTPYKFIQRYVSGAVAGGVEIFAGSLVCRDTDGYLVPAADTAGLKSAVGRAEFYVDNTDGADGDVQLTYAVGVFAFDVSATISASDAATIDLLGTAVTVKDDHTVDVAANTTNDIAAGTLDEFDAENGLYYIAVGL